MNARCEVNERSFRTRPITKTQIIGILALTLALFFIVSFATRSVDLYRMKAWRARLESEIAGLRREKLALEFEIRRRESTAWVDQALRGMGRVPPGTLLVTPSEATQGQPSASAPALVGDSTPATGLANILTPASAGGAATAPALFANPTWEAWRKLIWQSE